MEFKGLRAPWPSGVLPPGKARRSISSKTFNPTQSSAGKDPSVSGIRPKRPNRSKTGPAAPRVDADHRRIAQPAQSCQITWLGHASFLIQLRGPAPFNLLVDPVLTTRRLGKLKRFVDPGLTPSELPVIHGVLITHEHGDHLDERTLQALSTDIPVIVPEGLGSFFDRRGWSDIRELGWWDSTELPEMSASPNRGDRRQDPPLITLTPARHGASSSGFFKKAIGLCGGFVIENSNHAIYHAGDTAFFDGFTQVGSRFPQLDAALLPVGAYDRQEKVERRHLTPEEAGRAFLQTGAKRLIPMHWGTFQLSDEPLREGPDRLRSWWYHAALGDERLLTEMAVGDTVGWESD